MHHQAERFFTGLDSGLEMVVEILNVMTDKNTVDGIASLLLKLLCNIFQNGNGKIGMSRNYKVILDSLRIVNQSRTNPNVRTSLGCLLVNYSIDVYAKAQGGQG